MSKPLILTSPKGRAIFPHLTEPDTKFKPEGEYHVKQEGKRGGGGGGGKGKHGGAPEGKSQTQ